MTYKKMIIITILIILIAGCTTKQEISEPECGSGQIKVAGECCFDKNTNDVCDDFEKEVTKPEPVEEIKEEPKVEEIAPKSVVVAPEITNDIDPDELEVALIEEFYPEEKYYFDNLTYINATGLKNTYRMRAIYNPSRGQDEQIDVERFQLLIFKKEYNYLDTYKDYEKFIDDLYGMQIKDNLFYVKASMDYHNATRSGWSDMNYTIIESFKRINDDYSYMDYLAFLHRSGGNTMWMMNDLDGYVICSPQIVIKFRTGLKSKNTYMMGKHYSYISERVAEEKVLFKEEMLNTSKRLIDLCAEIG